MNVLQHQHTSTESSVYIEKSGTNGPMNEFSAELTDAAAAVSCSNAVHARLLKTFMHFYWELLNEVPFFIPMKDDFKRNNDIKIV